MYDFVSFQLIPKWVKRSLGTTRGRGKGEKKKTPQELIPVKTENFTSKTLKHVDYWLNLHWAEWGLTAWVYFYLAQGPRDINDGPICLQSGGPGFDPWLGKSPWRRKWQPPPVSPPGEPHGRRSLFGHSPPGRRESDKPERRHFHFPARVLLLTWLCRGPPLRPWWGSPSARVEADLLPRGKANRSLGSLMGEERDQPGLCSGEEGAGLPVRGTRRQAQPGAQWAHTAACRAEGPGGAGAAVDTARRELLRRARLNLLFNTCVFSRHLHQHAFIKIWVLTLPTNLFFFSLGKKLCVTYMTSHFTIARTDHNRQANSED